MVKDKVMNLEEFNKFEESRNGLLANGEEIDVSVNTEEVDDIKIYDLHESIGVKVEETSSEKEQSNSSPEVTMSGKLQFTKAEEEILVNLVKANQCLWNSSCSDFKNDKKTTEVWEQIALHMNKPVEDLKKQWRNLRGIYVKEIWKPTGLEPTAEGDENVFSLTDDELTANRLSLLGTSPTERKRRSSSCSATIAASDVQSLSTSSEFSSTEFEYDAYQILQLFHYYGELVAKLPRDLQRIANIKTMGLINKMDEIASNRTI